MLLSYVPSNLVRVKTLNFVVDSDGIRNASVLLSLVIIYHTGTLSSDFTKGWLRQS